MWEGFLLNGSLRVEEIVWDPLGPVLTVAGTLEGTEEVSVGFHYLLLHPSSALPADTSRLACLARLGVSSSTVL